MSANKQVEEPTYVPYRSTAHGLEELVMRKEKNGSEPWKLPPVPWATLSLVQLSSASS